MPDAGSVSQWLLGLKGGDSVAAQKLWERYYHRLVSLARAKLRGRGGGWKTRRMRR